MAAFVLQGRIRDDGGPARIGFTVSRKVGTAVERNRVRRRLRDIVRRSAADDLRSGYDYVLVGRRTALSRQFDQKERRAATRGVFFGFLLRHGPQLPALREAGKEASVRLQAPDAMSMKPAVFNLKDRDTMMWACQIRHHR